MQNTEGSPTGFVRGSLTLTAERVQLIPAKNGFARVCICECGMATCLPEYKLARGPKTCGHPHARNTQYVVWQATGELMTMATAITRAGINGTALRRDLKRGKTCESLTGGLFRSATMQAPDPV